MTGERIMYRTAWIVVLLLCLWNSAEGADSLVRRQWQIDGVSREALVYVPPAATTAPTPVVFAFHGHGGTMEHAAKTFAYHKHWPEAIAVYPQGLNTPGVLTDPLGKKPGWQKTVGDQNDRDLKFFDAMLATLKKDYQIDEKRVYLPTCSGPHGAMYSRPSPLREPSCDGRRANSSPSRYCTLPARKTHWCVSSGRRS
jgi:polyhydroxybutyrate depolymerase